MPGYAGLMAASKFRKSVQVAKRFKQRFGMKAETKLLRVVAARDKAASKHQGPRSRMRTENRSAYANLVAGHLKSGWNARRARRAKASAARRK